MKKRKNENSKPRA